MAIRRIDYNPIRYNELIETVRLAKLRRMEKISFDKSSGLEELSGKRVGERFEFYYDYGFNGHDLENILKVHAPKGANAYVHWSRNKGRNMEGKTMRINFYKIEDSALMFQLTG